MENDAIASRPGTDCSTVSCPTSATEPTETTPQTLASGVVESVTASATPDRSSLLSADEAQRLARIARDRANRFMVSGPDVDMLLDIITRFSK